MMETNNSLVSIIVPVYNVAEYVFRCLESLAAQTYSPIEIIVVDDGSTDGCAKICDDFARDKEQFTVIHQFNAGLSAARNTGLNYCHGKYITFVDSDDSVEPDFVSELLKCITEKRADIAVCGIDVLNESGKKVDHQVLRPHVLTSFEAMDCLAKRENGLYTVVWNKLYSSNLWRDLRFPEGRQHEDTFVMHRLYHQANCVAFTDKVLYNYLLRSQSIMHKEYSVSNLDEVEAFCDRVDYCREQGVMGACMDTAMYFAIGALAHGYAVLDCKDGEIQRRLQECRLLVLYAYEGSKHWLSRKTKLVMFIFRLSPWLFVGFYRIHLLMKK